TTSTGSKDKAEIQRLVQVYSAAAEKAETDKKSDAAGAIWTGVGRWDCALGNEEEAEKAFNKAFKADNTPSVYKNFWDAWSSESEDGKKWALGKLDEGIQKARTLRDETTLEWLLLRKVYSLRDSYSLREAVTLLQETLKIDSKDKHASATS